MEITIVTSRGYSESALKSRLGQAFAGRVQLVDEILDADSVLDCQLADLKD